MTADCRHISNKLSFSTHAYGVMKFDETTTDGFLRMCASEHLKHTAQISGGGGRTAVSQD